MGYFRGFLSQAAKLACLASLILACSCLAPLSNSFTGRSLGQGRIGLEGEAVTAGSKVTSA